MCCRKCAEIVEEEVRGVHGVFGLLTDFRNNRVTILESPGRCINHEQLLRKLRRIDKKAKFVESKSLSTSSPTTVYFGYAESVSSASLYNSQNLPSFQPLKQQKVPEPASSVASFYTPLQHQVGCEMCRVSTCGICANCGRMFPLHSFSNTTSSKEADSPALPPT